VRGAPKPDLSAPERGGPGGSSVCTIDQTQTFEAIRPGVIDRGAKLHTHRIPGRPTPLTPALSRRERGSGPADDLDGLLDPMSMTEPH